MNMLAAAYLAFWVAASLAFHGWKKSTTYPPRPRWLDVLGAFWEISGALLAVWVIVS